LDDWATDAFGTIEEAAGPCAEDMDVGVSDRRDGAPPPPPSTVDEEEFDGTLDMNAARGIE
jgi:hypothetical protein